MNTHFTDTIERLEQENARLREVVEMQTRVLSLVNETNDQYVDFIYSAILAGNEVLGK